MKCTDDHQGYRSRVMGLQAGVLLMAGGLLCGAWDSLAQDSPRAEYEVKAEFLPLFAQFVKWPSASFADTNAPLVIGVLGDDPFGAALDRAVKNQNTAGGRRLVVKRSQDIEDVAPCHLLFVSKSEKDHIDRILAVLAQGGRAVLTVGDAEGFAARGGIINFVLQEKKVRFEINPEAAGRGGLIISWELLNLARIVHATKEKESD
ncbi:MAG: YfiR family protein [bacterium]